MVKRSESLGKINRQTNNVKSSSSVDSGGDVKGLILSMKKPSRLAPKFFGKQYKTMYATIPSSNPRQTEIYGNKARSRDPKRKLVFDSVVDFRDPSTLSSINAMYEQVLDVTAIPNAAHDQMMQQPLDDKCNESVCDLDFCHGNACGS